MNETVTITRIFIEIDKNTKQKLEFDTDQVTGQQIKEKAGIPLDNDLAKRQGQRLELVTNDQLISIKNGDQFVSLPPGTVS